MNLTWEHQNTLQKADRTSRRHLDYQFSSVAQSCPTLCDPMNRSTPNLPVCHQLPEFTQIHVHQVSVAIQPSHPLSSPSLPAPNPSQHQDLFQWVNSLHAKVLEFQLQHHSLQRNSRADLLQNGLVGSPCSPRDSQESSPTPQFKTTRQMEWLWCSQCSDSRKMLMSFSCYSKGIKGLGQTILSPGSKNSVKSLLT